MTFGYLLGFMLEALVIVVIAKLVRDRRLRARGQHVTEMIVTKRSAGAATTQAGYLIGVLLGFMGAVSARGEHPGFVSLAGFVALSGLLAIALLLVADELSDRLVFRGLAEADDSNLALAVGKAAVSLATGLVLRGALASPETGLAGRIVWFAVAQAIMVLAVIVYFRLTPYDDLAEIKRNNVAAGFPVAGILLAVGLVMESAISGPPAASTVDAALGVGKFLGVSLALVYLFRLTTDLVLLPKVKLSRAIAEDGNVAAGIQEGVSFLLAALVVTFFLG
jgi:uncharacterized membrane protein YjfL (UPF0719 family)